MGRGASESRPLLQARVDGFMERVGGMCVAEVVADAGTPSGGKRSLEEDGWHIAVGAFDTDRNGLDLYTPLCEALIEDGALDAASKAPWSEADDLFVGWNDSPEAQFTAECQHGPTVELSEAVEAICRDPELDVTWQYLHQEVFGNHILQEGSSPSMPFGGLSSEPEGVIVGRTRAGPLHLFAETLTIAHPVTPVTFPMPPIDDGLFSGANGDSEHVIVRTYSAAWEYDLATEEWEPLSVGHLGPGFVHGTRWVRLDRLESIHLESGQVTPFTLEWPPEHEQWGAWGNPEDPNEALIQVADASISEVHTLTLYAIDLTTGSHREIWRNDRARGLPMMVFMAPLSRSRWVVKVPTTRNPSAPGVLALLDLDTLTVQMTDECAQHMAVYDEYVTTVPVGSGPRRWYRRDGW